MKDTRYLCARCVQDYKQAGYIVKPTYNPVKDRCDICDRLAFEYEISKEDKNVKGL